MTEAAKKPLAGKRLANAITACARNKLAEHISTIDCRKSSGSADFFVICQGDTAVQNRAIADAIMEGCRARGTKPWHCEGEIEGRWILIDFSDVVVHIMTPELRLYYRLETLWSEGVAMSELSGLSELSDS
ncbi:MAG: ribosome silencing factor [Chitinispirillaceae bacterium]|jgi:ribosome-associated protein|nr:ribosome silencing factor [Chitinispirillaceae bacterium]